MKTPSPRTSLGTAIVLMLAMTPAAVASNHETEAQDYCSGQGGAVVELKPSLWPNTENQVDLAGSLKVCQFTSQDGDNVEQLVVDLTTLHSEKPTLAGLAYLSVVPASNAGAAGSNPASSYCPDDLGGTESFGTAATGGWVGALDPGMEAGDAEPLSNTVDLCVFTDRSAIDGFGIFYAAAGTFRGVDLASVMRYQPGDDLPKIFATDS
jgi:hypothetical protein